MSDTVIGAIIGASIALIGMIVAKESKISELRQQWIDGLRSDVAKLVSLALHVGMSISIPDLRYANERIGLIRLRLNMKEQASKDLVEAMDKLEKNAVVKNPKLEAFADDVIQKTQSILRAE
jgi:phosphate/sulfate permease